MKTLKFLALAVCPLLLAPSCKDEGEDGNVPQEKVQNPEIVVPETKTFVTDYFKTVEACTAANENISLSPVSLEFVLAQLANGTKGQGYAELVNVLGTGSADYNALNSYYKLVRSSLTAKTDSSFNMTIANSIWTDRSCQLNADFSRRLLENFNCESKQVDFAHNSSDALSEILKWVSDETNGKINNFNLNVSQETLVALLNSVYFKADWKSQFSDDYTSEYSFEDASGSSLMVDMMYQQFGAGAYHEDDYRPVYMENDKCQALEYLYENEDFAMTFVLPKEGVSMSQLVNNTDWDHFSADTVEYDMLQMYIPRFKVENDIDLIEIFSKMGIKSLFNEGLSEMGVNAFLNQAGQKAVVEVNERGTVGAAVSYVGFITGETPYYKPVKFSLNRPFVYMVRQKSTGNVLFIGRVSTIK